MSNVASDRDACSVLQAQQALDELTILLTYSLLSFEARWFATWRLQQIRTALHVQREAVGLAPLDEAAA